jgi:alpha-tubulin suppressor-like RCC1 family protein
VITPPVQVAILDAFANPAPSATNAVTIALGVNPTGATLSGTTTVTPVGGVAKFTDLGIDRPGTGYTLAATAPGLTGAASAPFNFVIITFAAVSAGDHACGLTPAGTAYCWGFNYSGALGNGTTANSATPVAVAGGLTFAVVSAGAGYTCGVTPAGAAYCWGSNDSGALGNGTTTNSTAPVAVAGGLRFAALTAGQDFHTCGVTPAGAAYCWGLNIAGQLGNGTVTAVDNPMPVAVSGGLTFAAVSAGGENHTCGVTSAGAAYCWGANDWGQLGVGTTIFGSTAPVAVAGGLTFAAVSAGFNHTCGLTPAGAVYCWGFNYDGELGNGTTANSTAPVAVAGGLTFAAVSAGYRHTCGLTPAGVAYCWGSNSNGQLGVSNTTFSATPIAVAGGRTFAAVSAGWGTCGLTPAGAVYCWGYN